MKQFKLVTKYVFGLIFIVAGSLHFMKPHFYLLIMPSYLPFPLALIYISGACEIALGALILIPQYTQFAAWGIIALLIAVFPANVNMVLHPEIFPQVSELACWCRLPIQGLLILWAYAYTQKDKADFDDNSSVKMTSWLNN
jgi:uncharacterized membrane protein